MSKMGISVISSYRGGYNFEARRPVAHPGRRVFPRHAVAHLRHRPDRHPASAVGALHARAWNPRRRSRCRSAASTRYRKGGETHAWAARADPHAAGGGRQRIATRPSSATARRSPRLPPVALRDLLDFRPTGKTPISIDEVESITEIRKRFVTPGMSLGALSPRGARHAQHRHEPDRRQVGLRRGRRGPGALQAAAERRQRQLGDQADRLGPLRRHRRISQPTAARSRSRSRRAPSPARAASCPASR